MDEFGVLVKSYGIKPQGKSSPMASSKITPKPTHNYTNNNSVNLDPSSFGPNSSTGPSFNDDLFGFNNSQSQAQAHVFDDVFTIPSKTTSFSGGGGFDIESMFKGSMNLNSKGSEANDDDLIWGFSGKTTTTSSSNVVGLGRSDDLLSSDPVDDFFGKFGSYPSGFNVVNIDDDDDLLPGFGVSNAQHHRAQAGSRENSGSSLDELEDFVTGGTKKTAGRHLSGFSATKEAKKTSSSSLEELEDFVTGGAKKSAKGHLNGFSASKEAKKTGASLDDFDNFVTGSMKKTDKGHSSGFSAKKEAKKAVSEKSQETNFFDIEGSFNGDSVHKDKVENVSDLLFPEEATDLDTFFGAHTKKSVPVTEDKTMNMQADGVPDLFSETTYRMEKNVPSSGFPDDFSSIFGGASTSAVFEEIEGESEERRRARLGRYQRASARMAQALAEMNEREYQAQQEQEEKHRLADAMDIEMKQWAAGKEGNLRALLSSLQQVDPSGDIFVSSAVSSDKQVLAPELGWRPVTLTDLITSSQVKIAYKKAALCVHPDKVQQKGASLQQKFVAEKVFDLLKEAWNKFNAEELR